MSPCGGRELHPRQVVGLRLRLPLRHLVLAPSAACGRRPISSSSRRSFRPPAARAFAIQAAASSSLESTAPPWRPPSSCRRRPPRPRRAAVGVRERHLGSSPRTAPATAAPGDLPGFGVAWDRHGQGKRGRFQPVAHALRLAAEVVEAGLDRRPCRPSAGDTGPGARSFRRQVFHLLGRRFELGLRGRGIRAAVPRPAAAHAIAGQPRAAAASMAAVQVRASMRFVPPGRPGYHSRPPPRPRNLPHAPPASRRDDRRGPDAGGPARDDPDDASSAPRIIGGDLRGRRLAHQPGGRTRPMKDRVRESLFDLLGTTVRRGPSRSTSSPARAPSASRP